MKMHKYQVGDEVKVKIVGIQPYGAFGQLDSNFTGLIHISEISDRYVRNIGDYFKVGDLVDAKIIEIDEVHRHVKLSLKRVESNRKRLSETTYRRKPYSCPKMGDFPIIYQNSVGILQQDLAKGADNMLKLNTQYCAIKPDFNKYQAQVSAIDQSMRDKTGAGNDYLGWYEYPNTFSEKEASGIDSLAAEFRSKYDVLVVCGIGGSYLGARAAIEAITGFFPVPHQGMKVVYLGNTFSSNYTKQVLDYLEHQNFAVNVISKSGTTTETALAFRLVRELLIKRYGKEEACKRIVATTDREKGCLRDLARLEGYQTLVVPNDIGGRYSVLTPVGLFPIACAGIDIHEMLLGSKKAYLDLNSPDLQSNVAYQYAVYRHELYTQGYKAEMLINYEPQMAMFNEWWKQLFGESEGKAGQGLLPTSAIFSTDLHSLGQFIQEGSKILFETVLKATEPIQDITLKKENVNLDELNYLAGKTLNYVQDKAQNGTLAAHAETGKVPNLVLEYPKMDAYNFGYLVYFFMRACGMSAYLGGVNPFNQPGVEIYKKNMFQLLGKKK